MEVDGENAPLALHLSEYHRPGAIPPEDTRAPILPVHSARHDFCCHQENGSGRPAAQVLAARFTNPLQAAVYRLAFRTFAPGLEVAELLYKAHRWTRPRRLIVVREELTRWPTARGRELFHCPGYRFHAVVTTLTVPPEEVWRTYHGRADTENRLKELKHAFGADGFCSQAFWATEAALRCICLLYNLLEEFQRSLGAPIRRTLATLRTTLFACGAILGRDGRQTVLRLSRPREWQTRFLGQLRRLLTWGPNCNAVPELAGNA